jgi:hypothetical protein
MHTGRFFNCSWTVHNFASVKGSRNLTAISFFKALAFGFFPVITSSYPPGITGKVEKKESAQCFEFSKASRLWPQHLPYTSECQDCKLHNSY